MPISFHSASQSRHNADVDIGKKIPSTTFCVAQYTFTDARRKHFQTLSLLLKDDFTNFTMVKQLNVLLKGPQGKRHTAAKVGLATQSFILQTDRFH